LVSEKKIEDGPDKMCQKKIWFKKYEEYLEKVPGIIMITL